MANSALEALKKTAKVELPKIKKELEEKEADLATLQGEIKELRESEAIYEVALGTRSLFGPTVNVDDGKKEQYKAAFKTLKELKDDKGNLINAEIDWFTLTQIKAAGKFGDAVEKAVRAALLKEGVLEEQGQRGSYKLKLA